MGQQTGLNHVYRTIDGASFLAGSAPENARVGDIRGARGNSHLASGETSLARAAIVGAGGLEGSIQRCHLTTIIEPGVLGGCAARAAS